MGGQGKTTYYALAAAVVKRTRLMLAQKAKEERSTNVQTSRAIGRDLLVNKSATSTCTYT